MSQPPTIISTNFVLTESQNFLRYSKTQNKLLAISFLLYSFATIPALIIFSTMYFFDDIEKFIRASSFILICVILWIGTEKILIENTILQLEDKMIKWSPVLMNKLYKDSVYCSIILRSIPSLVLNNNWLWFCFT